MFKPVSDGVPSWKLTTRTQVDLGSPGTEKGSFLLTKPFPELPGVHGERRRRRKRRRWNRNAELLHVHKADEGEENLAHQPPLAVPF